MKHVCVESNWIFDSFAPAHRKSARSLRLLELAASGQLRLHVPAICLREGEAAIRRKCSGRDVRPLQDFRKWAQEGGLFAQDENEAALKFLVAYEAATRKGIDGLGAELLRLPTLPGVHVFPLSEPMLERVIAIRDLTGAAFLKPFDEAIFGAVLVLGEALAAEGQSTLTFCTLDHDLQHDDLRPLYKKANVEVQNGFSVQ